MNIAERTVRNYWTKIQDLLAVYPEEDNVIGINLLSNEPIKTGGGTKQTEDLAKQLLADNQSFLVKLQLW